SIHRHVLRNCFSPPIKPQSSRQITHIAIWRTALDVSRTRQLRVSRTVVAFVSQFERRKGQGRSSSYVTCYMLHWRCQNLIRRFLMAVATTAKQPIERSASLKDAAYTQIKNLLLGGQLAPDRLYSAQYFAEMLGVSRTPIREALLQLTGEGFLVCHDVRGFQIKEFTDKEIRD